MSDTSKVSDIYGDSAEMNPHPESAGPSSFGTASAPPACLRPALSARSLQRRVGYAIILFAPVGDVEDEFRALCSKITGS